MGGFPRNSTITKHCLRDRVKFSRGHVGGFPAHMVAWEAHTITWRHMTDVVFDYK